MRCRVLLPALALLGCSDGFDPYSKLSSLRVLAMRSQPAMPRAGSPAVLQALVHAPVGQQVAYRWSYCPVAAPAKDAYACPLAWEAAAKVLGTDLPAYDLGNSAEAVFAHAWAPATLTRLCAQGIATTGYAGKVDCDLGFPITVSLDVATGGENLRAAFTVFLPVLEDPASDNHNPTLDALVIEGAPADDAPWTVQAKAATDVHVTPAAEAVESRAVPVFEGGVGTRPERLTFSWFSDTGSWKKDRTAYIADANTLDDAASNTWTAPESTRGPAVFHVVVRDDRGGVGWTTRVLDLETVP